MKKGNINISEDDFKFDDELFPLDDSVYDDDEDELAGFKFDPNSEGPVGVRGFFANTMKSIKGVGLDFADEFLPDVMSNIDDVKYAISETKDKFIDMKDKALGDTKSALSSIKDKQSSKENKSIIKNAFKDTWGNIKKGKFYLSARDTPIDMNAMLDDDDEDEDSQEEKDTSGVMTTKFNYRKKSSTKKRQRTNALSDNAGTINAMASIEENSIEAQANINSKLINRSIANSNSNAYATINILKNISDNLSGLSDFLTHYGKTNINAALEFDTKALAFLTDQRALLKDILRSTNASIGIKEKSEDEEDEGKEKNKLFGLGNQFDFNKYISHIGQNAKDMFLGTSLGMGADQLNSLKQMLGKDSGMGKMISGKSIVSSIIKSTVLNSLVTENTKDKLGKLNEMFGSIGGTIATKANNWKDSSNPIASFFGELLGTNGEGLDKTFNLNKQDLNEQTVFDIKTKETINETIPEYLSKIYSALSGTEETYYDHQAKQLRTKSSFEERYNMAIKNQIDSNLRFSTGFTNAEGSIKEQNRINGKPIDEKIISKALDLFKNNLIESREALVPNLLMKTDGSGDSYREKMFRGFDSLVGDDSYKSKLLKDIIGSEFVDMAKEADPNSPNYLEQLKRNEAIANITSSVLPVSNAIENTAKEFKEYGAKIGAMSSVAKLNQKEKYEKIDYDKKYSSLYNANLIKNNTIKQNEAKIRLAQLNVDEFNERTGFLSTDVGSYGMANNPINKSASEKLSDIYELLSEGIVVYPNTDPSALSKHLEINKNRYNQLQEGKLKYKNSKENEKNEFENLRKLQSEEAYKIQNLEFKNKYLKKFGIKGSGILQSLQTISPVEYLANGLIDKMSGALGVVMGKGSVNSILNNNALEMTAEQFEELQKEIDDTKSQIRDRKKNQKKALNKISGGRFSKFSKKVDDFKQNIEDSISIKANNAIMQRNKNIELKKKNIRKSGTFIQQTLGNKAYAKLNSYNSENIRANAYVDPDYLDRLSDTKQIQFIQDLVNHQIGIVDYIDENTDIVIGKESKLDKSDKDIVKKIGITVFEPNKNVLEEVIKYVDSKTIYNSNMNRVDNYKQYENNNIDEWNERNSTLTEKSKRKFDINEQKFEFANVSKSKIVQNAHNEYINAQKEYDKHIKSIKGKNSNYYKNSKLIKSVRQKINNDVSVDKETLKKYSNAIDENEEIDKLTKSLLDNVNKSKHREGQISEYERLNSATRVNKWNISRIKNSGEAGKAFLNKKTQDEIDELLASGDKRAILEFANNIKSKHEGSLSQEDKLNYLDPKFGGRIQKLFADPILKGLGVSIKDSVRSPLAQFALYSKGRVDPEITDLLLKSAGFSEGLNMYPEEFRTKMGDSGIVARTLSSNHMTGRAVDLDNGNASWNLIAKTAANYGIKWAGEDDKPHFEYDGSFKKSNVSVDNTAIPKVSKKQYSVTGKLIDRYQSDPSNVSRKTIINTIDNKKYDEYESFWKTEIKNLSNDNLTKNKRIIDIFLNMNSNIERIANNTESIGIGIGIKGTGVIGDGLGKIGSSVKDVANKMFGFAKDQFDNAKNNMSKTSDKLKAIWSNKENDESNPKEIEDKKKKLNKFTKLELIMKFGLDKKLNLDPQTLIKKYSKTQLIELILDVSRTKTKSIYEKVVNKTEKGREWTFGKLSSLKEKGSGAIEKGTELLGSLFNNAKSLAYSLFNTGKDIAGKAINFGGDVIKNATTTGGKLLNKGKDFLIGRTGEKFNKENILAFLKDKNINIQSILNKSDEEIMKIAKENGYQPELETKEGMISKAFNFAKKTGSGIINTISNRSGKKFNNTQFKSLMNMLKIINNSILSLSGKIIITKNQIKRNEIFEKLGMSKDKILELYEYDDLRKIDKNNKMQKFAASKNSETSKEKEFKSKGFKEKVVNTKAAAAGKLKSLNELVKNKKINSLIKLFNLEKQFDMDSETIRELYSDEEIIKYCKAISKGKLYNMKERAEANIKQGISLAGKGLKFAKDKTISGSKKIGSAIYNIGKYSINGAKNILSNGYDFITEKGSSLTPGIKDFTKKSVQTAGVLFDAGINGVKNFGHNISNLAGKGLNKLKGFGSNILNNGINVFGNNFKKELLNKLDIIDNDILISHGKEPKIKTNLPAVSATVANAYNDSGEAEGSYADQKRDKETLEQKERDDNMAKNIASIAAVLGTTTSAKLAANGTVQPEPNLASMMMANYQNSELQNQILSEVNENTAKAAKNGGRGGNLNAFGGLLKTAALPVAGLAAAGAGVAMLVKQASNKIKSFKHNWKDSSVSEKIGMTFGVGGSSNYDANGNKITDKNLKSGAGFGLNQAGHIAGFMKILSKIFSSKAMQKACTKLGGEAATKFIGKLPQALVKFLGNGLSTVTQKVGSFIAKASNPVGWGVIIAQLVYDVSTGAAEANRYFGLGKGIKPTPAQRLIAGLSKAISGSLTFGLLPPEALAGMLWNFMGSKADKAEQEKGKEFVKQRAKILEVEAERLTEFETMTWSERLFGGDKKRASILGFMNPKIDRKTCIDNFKTWFDKLYQPADNIFKDLKKKYGGKVDKTQRPDDMEGIENQEKFRSEYLKLLQDYKNKNRLNGLGPLGIKETKNDEDKLISSSDYWDEKKGKVTKVDEAAYKEEAKTIPAIQSTTGELVTSSLTNNNESENNQADGINYKKVNDSNYISKWEKQAKASASRNNEIDKLNSARMGIKPSFGSKLKKGLSAVGGAISSKFKQLKDIAKNFASDTKDKISNFKPFKAIKSAADAIAQFIGNRRETEQQITSQFSTPEGQQNIINFQNKIKDPKALGQQTSTSVLSPQFAERIEAFLKDRRIAGHGVKIRESYRSPATQLAYYSKGRAPKDVTDKLMKIAGFKSGINFWSPSFQKPGDVITWTLGSNHFSGTAVDLEPGDIGYETLGKIASEYGIDWGGNWSTPDKPHFELGDPNFNIANATSGATESEIAQADSINYDHILPNQNSITVGKIDTSKTFKNNIFNSISKKTPKSSISSITKIAKNTVNKNSSSSVTKTDDNSKVISNLVSGKFDELLAISTEGVNIMEQIHSEMIRHNKFEEKALGNIIKGLGALGAIISASQNGGYSSAGNTASITKGLFDSLAKGL